MREVQGGGRFIRDGMKFSCSAPFSRHGCFLASQPAIDLRFSTLCLVGVVPDFAFNMLQHIYCILFGPIDPHLCIARYLMWNCDSYKENQTK
jgi:hypothetical protein